MAHPNLNSPAKVEGLSVASAVGTSATAIVSNAASSGKSLRVVGLWVANIDGSSAADVTADVYDGTTGYKLASTVSVPADATLELIGQRPLYLKEGDSLRLTASAAGDLEAVVSYEEIT